MPPRAVKCAHKQCTALQLDGIPQRHAAPAQGDCHQKELSPRKYVNTIMDLREQVSREWVGNSELIARENAEHWRHHLAMVTNCTDPEAGLQNGDQNQGGNEREVSIEEASIAEVFIASSWVRRCSQNFCDGEQAIEVHTAVMHCVAFW